MRVLRGCLLLLMVLRSECRPQDGKQPIPASSDLASLAAEEAKRGVYVFYTQSFIDKENKRVSYRGSVYGAIQTFDVRGCEVKIEATVVDKFSGTVGHRPIGQLQDTYQYSASFVLTSEIAANTTLVQSRPAQLGSNTHSVCVEQASCSFWWVRMEAKHNVIHEVSTVNDSSDFNGQVDHFIAPVSSREAGNRLIDQIRAIADSRCH